MRGTISASAIFQNNVTQFNLKRFSKRTNAYNGDLTAKSCWTVSVFPFNFLVKETSFFTIANHFPRFETFRGDPKAPCAIGSRWGDVRWHTHLICEKLLSLVVRGLHRIIAHTWGANVGWSTVRLINVYYRKHEFFMKKKLTRCFVLIATN